MIVCRRRDMIEYNNIMILTLNLNPGKFAFSMAWGILTSRSKNPILNLFLIRSLVLAYKLPQINILKAKLNINLIKNNSMFVQISNFLNRQLWHELLFKLKYRYYSFQEKLFVRKNERIELYFVKLPNNLRLKRLESIESGEAFNFKLCIFGRYTYIETIYILNQFGFTNLQEACNASGLNFENTNFSSTYKSRMDFFFSLNDTINYDAI